MYVQDCHSLTWDVSRSPVFIECSVFGGSPIFVGCSVFGGLCTVAKARARELELVSTSIGTHE